MLGSLLVLDKVALCDLVGAKEMGNLLGEGGLKLLLKRDELLFINEASYNESYECYLEYGN